MLSRPHHTPSFKTSSKTPTTQRPRPASNTKTLPKHQRPLTLTPPIAQFPRRTQTRITRPKDAIPRSARPRTNPRKDATLHPQDDIVRKRRRRPGDRNHRSPNRGRQGKRGQGLRRRADRHSRRHGTISHTLGKNRSIETRPPRTAAAREGLPGQPLDGSQTQPQTTRVGKNRLHQLSVAMVPDPTIPNPPYHKPRSATLSGQTAHGPTQIRYERPRDDSGHLSTVSRCTYVCKV